MPYGDAATDQKRLERLVRARHPAIWICTTEEAEARDLIARTLNADTRKVCWWSAVQGIVDRGTSIPETTNPAAALATIAKLKDPMTLVLFDLSPALEDPTTLRALREAVDQAEKTGGLVVVVDHAQPPEGIINELVTRFELTLPDDDAIDAAVRATLKTLNRDDRIDIDVTKETYRAIVNSLRGLPLRRIRQIIGDVVIHDRRLNSDDLAGVVRLKRKLVSASGTLEHVESPATLDDVGGLSALKSWLRARERSFSDEAAEFGLLPPRGVLMLGVQGAGKSLCAKAIATAWQRPLLRMDPGALYDRFVGESERRLRDALRQAEAMAPVVLWIDEIEKAFASAAAQSTDGGLSQRMFGTLLTWMQDHRSPVFLVATANNIDALPPELLRKGRFDEIFFVDLPEMEARATIFEIHLRKRKQAPDRFDLAALAESAEGFSGAEIEQAVIAALHNAFSTNTMLSTEMILEILRTSPPLSETMREKIESLRHWAAGRCVPAG